MQWAWHIFAPRQCKRRDLLESLCMYIIKQLVCEIYTFFYCGYVYVHLYEKLEINHSRNNIMSCLYQQHENSSLVSVFIYFKLLSFACCYYIAADLHRRMMACFSLTSQNFTHSFSFFYFHFTTMQNNMQIYVFS